jgi:hypothetical protein
MEVIRTSEMLVLTTSTWCHIPEDGLLHVTEVFCSPSSGVNERELPMMLPEIAEKNAEELVAEEEREKRKVEKKKAKKKRRKEKKKEEKEVNCANSKCKSNSDNNINKKACVSEYNKKMANKSSRR